MCALGPLEEAAALSETSLSEAGALAGHPPSFCGASREGDIKKKIHDS